MMNAVFGSNTTDYKSTWLCESCNHEYLHENDSNFFFWNSKFLDFLHKHPPMSTETINDVIVGLPMLPSNFINTWDNQSEIRILH